MAGTVSLEADFLSMAAVVEVSSMAGIVSLEMDFLSMAAVVEVSMMAGTVSLAARIVPVAARVVSMADILAVGAEVGVKAGAADEDSMGTAPVLVEVVGGAGFFSLAVTEVSSRAETVLLMTGVASLEVALALGIAVAAEVAVEVVLEVATLLAKVVDTSVAVEGGMVVESLEATPELSIVVGACLASMTPLADDFDLVMVKDIS